MDAYAAVVGSSLHDLTKDGIGLALRVGVLGLERVAVLDVVAHLVVGATHSALMSDPGYQWEMARENAARVQGRRYALYAEVVGPTDLGWQRRRNDVEAALGASIVSPGT